MKKKSQKQQFKKRLFKVLLIILSLVTVYWFVAPKFLNPNTAYAVAGLNVEWGVPDGDPIFVVSNMLPGDTEQRSVDVINNGATSRDVSIRGVKTSEIGSLSTVLEFVISEGATDLYGGTTGTKTLDQFFTDSGGPNGLFLSTLAPGASTTYTFKAFFQSSAGNEFQNTQVIFDLIIGISADISDGCDQIDLLPTPVIGTTQAETLNGTPGNDLIMGLEGADIIYGHGGDDCIIGGPGAEDSIFGGEGNDVIFGNEDADSIYGENGDDLIIGGPGADNLYGGEGNDVIFGNENTDLLEGDSGNDFLQGGDGPDSLSGGAGDDNLVGDGGMDDANGGANTDTCDAESEISCEI